MNKLAIKVGADSATPAMDLVNNCYKLARKAKFTASDDRSMHDELQTILKENDFENSQKCINDLLNYIRNRFPNLAEFLYWDDAQGGWKPEAN